jgi:uncharacterized protein YuzE
MKRIKSFNYFFEEDVLYIPLGNDKSPIGDEDFQNSVVLYKLDEKVVGIEIQKFSKFKEDQIIIGQSDVLDLTIPFKRLRMVISLRDIIRTDPEQFQETMKIWGFEKLNDIPKLSSKYDISFKGKEITEFSFIE